MKLIRGTMVSKMRAWDAISGTWVRVTVDASGNLNVSSGGGGGGGGGLTDAQLRATAVPVSGTFYQATQPVSAAALPLPSGAATGAKQDTGNASLASILAALPAALVTGRLDVNVGASTTLPVSGPLTDTQLRASAVPISAASLPLPSGAATGTKQDTGNTSLASIDTKIPASPATTGKQDTGNTTLASILAALPAALVTGRLDVNIGSSTSLAVTGPLTDTQLRATPVPVSGTVIVTGPLTDTQLRATPVPVSGAVTATGTVAVSNFTDNGLTDTQLRASAVSVAETAGGTVDSTIPTRAVQIGGSDGLALRAVSVRVKDGVGMWQVADQQVRGLLEQILVEQMTQTVLLRQALGHHADASIDPTLGAK